MKGSVIVRPRQDRSRVEARRFSAGDFSDPRAIHGHEMPGTAELTRGASQVRVEYAPADDGGRIRYPATDPGLVAALHRWFEAQRMDHGS